MVPAWCLALMAAYLVAAACAMPTDSVELLAPEPTPQPCCLPPVWEGRLSSMSGQVQNGHVVSYLSDGSLHVDTKNNRFASNQVVEASGRRVNVTVIEFVSENVMYVIIKAMKTCLKRPAGAINNCIPPNASYMGTEWLGAGTSSLDVNAWGVHVTSGMDVYAKVLVTKDACIPVFQSTFGDVSDTKIMRSDNFHDVHEGIRDTGVFDVPEYCQNSPMVVMSNNVLSLISHHRIRRAIMA